ncbi:YfbU family protein [Metallibacterium sp.]
MKLTNPEKLILVMLSDIHEKLGIENSVDTKLLTSAIYSNNTWALSWELQGIVGDSPDPTPPEVSEVADILDMWSFIEEAYATFDASAKTKIEAEADPFGTHVQFSGFDGNNETTHMSIARFLVEDMGRFSRFKGRDLNSHLPSIGTYRRMLAVFEPIRKTLDGHGLTAGKVIKLLNAKRH